MSTPQALPRRGSPSAAQLKTIAIVAGIALGLVGNYAHSQPGVRPRISSGKHFAGASTAENPPRRKPVGASDRPETKLSKAEAEELFKSVDEILKFVSVDTGLPIKHVVKRELADRDTVERFMIERMRDDEDAQRMQRAEIVMKKMGLLPANFELQPFLIKLLREQVAGFYDFKTKTVYLLDWVGSEAQRPVLAHELTHALQDQNYDLERWTKSGVDNNHREEQDPNAVLAVDEQAAARAAVLEGQGMVTLLDFILEPAHKTLIDTPELLEFVKQGAKEAENLPFYHDAPLIIKESLGFPYSKGLEFEVAVLRRQGKKGAFNDALSRPPRDTHEIIHPEAYLSDKTFAPPHLPPLSAILGEKYRPYDVAAMGEFDVFVMLKQFSDPASAEAASKEWTGGLYYAALKSKRMATSPKNPAAKNGTAAAEKITTKDLALLHEYRFATAEAARVFADSYAKSLLRKYNFIDRIASVAAMGSTPGRSDVRNNNFGQKIPATPARSGGSQKKWSTNEGRVSLEVFSSGEGSTVLIMEGFDESTAAQLREAITSAPVKAATHCGLDPCDHFADSPGSMHGGELSLRLLPFISGSSSPLNPARFRSMNSRH